MFSLSKNTIEPFYSNRSYTILRILCENPNAHQHIACSGEAQLMLRSGDVMIESGKDCVSVKKGETVILYKNLVYSLKTSSSFDLLVAYPSISNLLYPVGISLG